MTSMLIEHGTEGGYDVISPPKKPETPNTDEPLHQLIDNNNVDLLIEQDRESFYDVARHRNLRCFHGNLSRSQANTALSQSGPGKISYGRFLVRKSDKLPRHLILSVVRHDRICHFPIELNENGTFNVFGETVLNFEDMYDYCKTYGKDMFKTQLTEPVISDFLPPEMWKTGKTTMLHKLVESGTEVMLRTVLDHPKCLPLGVKNDEGNTPLHSACYMGRDDMVLLLLSRKASPALINSYGWDCLHMAALGNNPSTLRILREQGKCDLSSRNPINMYTALHCAAACDNGESVKMLLALGADRSSQTDAGKSPLDLAQSFGAADAVKILSESQEHGHSVVPPTLQDWYINELCRLEQFIGDRQLKIQEGTFFVRPSVSNPLAYTICIAWEGKWVHVVVQKQERGYVVSGTKRIWKTLEEAVDSFHSQFKSVLRPISPVQAELLRKAAKQGRPGTRKVPAYADDEAETPSANEPSEHQLFSEAAESPSNVTMRRQVEKQRVKENAVNHSPIINNHKTNAQTGIDPTNAAHRRSSAPQLQRIVPNPPLMTGHVRMDSDEGNELPKGGQKKPLIGLPDIKGLVVASIFSLRSKARNIPTISASQVHLGKFLGEGNYGRVYDGHFVDSYSFTHPVAIKILKDSLDGAQRNEFLEEATVMRRLTHPFIVRLYGVVANKGDLWMIQELLPLGSLYAYLQANKNADLYEKVLLWTVQVADGMRYMESKHYVHRDLAARNLLLASLDQVKISDFGLSRYTGEEDLYVQHSTKAIPIAWYAPEAFTYYTFTNKSDVWSFAVTVWEMYTKGEHPYSEINGDPNFLLPYITAGNRLSRPMNCSLDSWNLLFSCWNIYPELRPSFEAIVGTLELLPEYFNAMHAVRMISMFS